MLGEHTPCIYKILTVLYILRVLVRGKSPLTPFVKSCLGVVKMSRFQYLNLAIFFGLGFFLYGFIFAKYHYKFTIFFGFLGLFWGGLVAFLILMAWNDDEKE